MMCGGCDGEFRPFQVHFNIKENKNSTMTNPSQNLVVLP